MAAELLGVELLDVVVVAGALGVPGVVVEDATVMPFDVLLGATLPGVPCAPVTPLPAVFAPELLAGSPALAVLVLLGKVVELGATEVLGGVEEATVDVAVLLAPLAPLALTVEAGLL